MSQIDVTALDPKLESIGQKAKVTAEHPSIAKLLLNVPLFGFYLCILCIVIAVRRTK